MRRSKTEDGWKLLHRSDRQKRTGFRPEYALVNGEQIRFPVGYYECFVSTKAASSNMRTWAITRPPRFTAKLAKEKLLTAKTAAQDAGVTLVEVPGRKYLRRAANLYIKDRENQGAMEAARQAQNVTDGFIASSGKTFLDEVTKDDVYVYQAGLRKRGNGVTARYRTSTNGLGRFFCSLAWTWKRSCLRSPNMRRALPTIYSTDQLASLREAADEYMLMVADFGSQCGLREREMVYLEWPDIKWTEKRAEGPGQAVLGNSRSKTLNRGTFPMPDELLERLAVWHEARDKAWRETHSGPGIPVLQDPFSPWNEA